LILFSIEKDILNLETFMGYKGDFVLKIMLENKEVKKSITNYAKLLNLYIKEDFEIDKRYEGVYNLFIAVENKEIYQLKSNIN